MSVSVPGYSHRRNRMTLRAAPWSRVGDRQEVHRILTSASEVFPRLRTKTGGECYSPRHLESGQLQTLPRSLPEEPQQPVPPGPFGGAKEKATLQAHEGLNRKMSGPKNPAPKLWHQTTPGPQDKDSDKKQIELAAPLPVQHEEGLWTKSHAIIAAPY